MHPRKFALIAGIVFLTLGVLSFVSDLSYDPYSYLPAMKLDSSYGLFLGLFAMNIINKLALISFGLVGIMASRAKDRSLPASITFSKLVAWVMIPGAILGLIPMTSTFFGYWPLFGNEIWLHGISGLLGAYYGYYLPRKAHDRLIHSPAA